MSSSLYCDTTLVDSSRPMPREEGDISRTILATVIGIIPTEMLAPPPVEMERDDNGVRHRPTYKDSFGSVRPLEVAPAVEPLIQPPAQNNESAPHEMDTIAVTPRLTYMDSAGRIRPLAAVVAAVRPYVPPTQNYENSPDAKYTGAVRRPAYKDSFGSGRFAERATVAAVRPHAENNETASDEDEAVRIRRPTYVDRADTHPSTAALMPTRVPLAQDNATTLDEGETGAGRHPMYKDCFGSVRLAVAEIPPLSAAKMKPKKVDEASAIFLR
jgi:hypothetical protein